MKHFEENKRLLPLHTGYDVIVAGAGPAGIAAAVAAGRQGANTLLIEGHGALGGVWTTGLLSWVIDAGGKGGVMREIRARLDERGATLARGRGFAYDTEEMKLLLEEMAVEAGVHVRLHTRVVGVGKKGRRVHTVITESKSGREAFEASGLIDATGDGDLAALAGCEFAYGDPVEGRAQPMSLVALVTGVQARDILPFIGGGVPQAKANLLSEFRAAGVDPSYAAPTLFRVRDDLFALMANHEYGVCAFDAEEVTRATLQSRVEVHRLVKALRVKGGPWAELRVVATAAQIGVREGRRIAGRYVVTAEDMFMGRRHEDAICEVTMGFDVHSTNPKEGKDYQANNTLGHHPYQIPLRALMARDVDGLMMAGRCISGDFLAHSSYRVTGNAVAMGEAAGVTTALAAKRGCCPHEVEWAEIKDLITTPCLSVAAK